MIAILADLLPDSLAWDGSEGNYSRGRLSRPVSILVMHATVGDLASSRAEFRRLGSERSAHYIIDKDGTVYQEVLEGDTAYHAGVSVWIGNININDMSIGIEMVNANDCVDQYPEAQYHAAVELARDIVARYSIQPLNVVGHKDVSPGRKTDPACFPMMQFKQDIYSTSLPPSSIPAPAPSDGGSAQTESLTVTSGSLFARLFDWLRLLIAVVRVRP